MFLYVPHMQESESKEEQKQKPSGLNLHPTSSAARPAHAREEE
jgi:hypothetical protein